MKSRLVAGGGGRGGCRRGHHYLDCVLVLSSCMRVTKQGGRGRESQHPRTVCGVGLLNHIYPLSTKVSLLFLLRARSPGISIELNIFLTCYKIVGLWSFEDC